MQKASRIPTHRNGPRMVFGRHRVTLANCKSELLGAFNAPSNAYSDLGSVQSSPPWQPCITEPRLS